jgi:hypothetical protein
VTNNQQKRTRRTTASTTVLTRSSHSLSELLGRRRLLFLVQVEEKAPLLARPDENELWPHTPSPRLAAFRRCRATTATTGDRGQLGRPRYSGTQGFHRSADGRRLARILFGRLSSFALGVPCAVVTGLPPSSKTCPLTLTSPTLPLDRSFRMNLKSKAETFTTGTTLDGLLLRRTTVSRSSWFGNVRDNGTC